MAQPLRRTAAGWFVAWLVVLAIPQAVFAQASGKITTAGHGLTVTSEWWNISASSGGYCPVHVELSNTGGPRTLRVVLESMNRPGGLEVSQTVEIDRGSKVAFTLSLPAVSQNSWSWLKVYERGRELEKLRAGGVGGVTWYSNQKMPTALLVSRSSPDLRLFIDAATKMGMSGGTSQTGYQPIIVPSDNLPKKWIDYTTLDLVLVSIKELEQMPAASRDAIVNWTLAGGNLFVYGVEGDREDSAVLKRILDLDQRLPRGAEWRLPKAEDRNLEPLTSFSNAQTMVTPQGVRAARRPARVAQKVPPAPNTSAAGQPKTASSEPLFSVRPFGLGQLVASSAADPFPGLAEDWAWMFKSLGPSRLFWNERHGITARGENESFWSFLIAGVGRAPVGGFQILITLFALLIGPVNYFVLRRRGKLYLLIVTVPTFAMCTTILLLGYAIASDGFALRMRARSLTMLDQTRGEAVSWSRVSYYAGLAPSGGLRFSPDTAVYPIEASFNSSARRVLDWTEDQHMTSGWLRSRTPTQVLAVGYRQTGEQLVVTPNPEGGVRVTNNLGTHVHMLMLADENGILYAAQNIGLGGSAKPAAQELSDAHQELRKLVNAQKLEPPSELEDRDFSSRLFGIRRYWGSSGAADWDTCILEGILQILGGDSAGLQALLQPRSYIAIVDQPPQVDVGVHKTQDSGSLYIIWGAY